MGIFDRWRRAPHTPPPGGHEGSVLPVLEPRAADRLMAMARAHLASRGREATIEDGYLRLDDGDTFGLHNLSVLASRVREKEWPQLVRAHLDGLLDKPDTSGPPDPGAVLVKLRRREEMPELPDYDAVEPVPGVLAVVAVDYPEVVMEALHLPEGIPDVETAMRLAVANLSALPPPEHGTRLLDDADESSRVHFFVSDDFFGASRLLVLHEVLSRAGIATGPGGVLVAVPNRHVIVVHPLAGPGVVPALNWLVPFAQEDFDTQPGSVSPHVYHLAADGRAGLVTREDEDGHAVVVEGAFGEAFLAATGEDEPPVTD